MYYVTPEQEKWLLANGLKPYCPEKGITLLESAQFIWSKFRIECAYECFSNRTEAKYNILSSDWHINASVNSNFNTIPEALSWAIDQAINHVNNQSNETN